MFDVYLIGIFPYISLTNFYEGIYGLYGEFGFGKTKQTHGYVVLSCSADGELCFSGGFMKRVDFSTCSPKTRV